VDENEEYIPMNELYLSRGSVVKKTEIIALYGGYLINDTHALYSRDKKCSNAIPLGDTRLLSLSNFTTLPQSLHDSYFL
jgi:hypothetical protein